MKRAFGWFKRRNPSKSKGKSSLSNGSEDEDHSPTTILSDESDDESDESDDMESSDSTSRLSDRARTRSLILHPGDVSKALDISAAEVAPSILASTLQAASIHPDSIALFEAVRAGDLPATKQALQHTLATADDVNALGQNPLHVAAYLGHASLIVALAKAGALVCNTFSEAKFFPLYLAAQQGQLAAVKALLVGIDFPADVSQKTSSGSTALYIAAANGHLDVVKYLVDVHGDDLNVTTASGATPIMAASGAGHLETVEWLLANGGDVTAARLDGVTALFLAAQEGHLDIVRFLVLTGFVPNTSRFEDGATALDAALAVGDDEIAGFLATQAYASGLGFSVDWTEVVEEVVRPHRPDSLDAQMLAAAVEAAHVVAEESSKKLLQDASGSSSKAILPHLEPTAAAAYMANAMRNEALQKDSEAELPDTTPVDAVSVGRITRDSSVDEADVDGDDETEDASSVGAGDVDGDTNQAVLLDTPLSVLPDLGNRGGPNALSGTPVGAKSLMPTSLSVLPPISMERSLSSLSVDLSSATTASSSGSVADVNDVTLWEDEKSSLHNDVHEQASAFRDEDYDDQDDGAGLSDTEAPHVHMLAATSPARLGSSPSESKSRHTLAATEGNESIQALQRALSWRSLHGDHPEPADSVTTRRVSRVLQVRHNKGLSIEPSNLNRPRMSTRSLVVPRTPNSPMVTHSPFSPLSRGPSAVGPSSPMTMPLTPSQQFPSSSVTAEPLAGAIVARSTAVEGLPLSQQPSASSPSLEAFPNVDVGPTRSKTRRRGGRLISGLKSPKHSLTAVHPPSGETTVLHLKPRATLGDLKGAVYRKLRVPVDDQHIEELWPNRGDILVCDEDTLDKLGVRDGQRFSVYGEQVEKAERSRFRRIKATDSGTLDDGDNPVRVKTSGGGRNVMRALMTWWK